MSQEIKSMRKYLAYRRLQQILKEIWHPGRAIGPNPEPEEKQFWDGKEKYFKG